MSRWDLGVPDRDRSSEPRIPQEQRRAEPKDESASKGRRGSSGRDAEISRIPSRPSDSGVSRERAQRPRLVERERRTLLRQSQLQAMSEIGTFRTVDTKDLARFAYQGDETRMQEDIRSLQKQGLVEEKTLYQAHKEPRQIVTLTKPGDRLLRKIGDLRNDQEIYHGFVKPREQDHDADLYKVYQKALEEIEKEGGRVLRVRLDFELKASINREREAAGQLPDDMKEQWLKTLAEEHGLTVRGKTIHVPDLQIEYETADREVARENLELVSRNYREDGIRGKAASGFTIYARSGDTSRIRRALHDSGMVGEVLSI